MRGSPELPTGDLGENRIEKRFPHRFCRDTHLIGVHARFQRDGKSAIFSLPELIRLLAVSCALAYGRRTS
jgi:hypothetical protein